MLAINSIEKLKNSKLENILTELLPSQCKIRQVA